MTAIEIERLSKRFGDVAAVDDLSFTVREGAVTGFLGPNGAGKTTTLRMLLGLVDADRRHGHDRRQRLRRPRRAVPPRRRDPRGRRASTRAGGRATTCACSPLAAGLPLSRVDAVLDEVGPRRCGPPPGQGLLARHAPAARPGRRAARRAPGADPGRARQRARPGRRPLAASVPARVRRCRRHGADLEPRAGRGRTDGRRRRDHRAGRLVTQSSLADLARRGRRACACGLPRPKRCARHSSARASPQSSSRATSSWPSTPRPTRSA